LIRKSVILQKAYTYKALSPVPCFLDAITSAKPDLIIAADDLSTQNLIALHAQQQVSGPSGKAICELIERSLGPRESFSSMVARASFMDLAREEGIKVPKTGIIRNRKDLEAWASQSGFPMVLKADGSSSGEGTKIARNLPQAEAAFHSLQRPASLVRVLKRVMLNHDWRSVPPKWHRRRFVVNAQDYIPGRDATSLVACWKGTILGALHFEVVEKQYSLGPASVMRLIENPEMEMAVARIVCRLKLSGLHGFDFLLEEPGGSAYMIEFNPRATQVGHLTLGRGRDLPGALYAAVTGKAPREAPKLTDNPTIALFPQESTRDPESAFLKTGYHDVPKQEPELMQEFLQQAQKSRTQQFLEACSRIFSSDRHPVL
jgi:ATP-grasp domain